MKKQLFLVPFIGLSLIFTSSCQKDNFSNENQKSEDILVINDLGEEFPEMLDFLDEDNSRGLAPKDSNFIEQGKYAFFYKAKKYECHYDVLRDSTVVFDNPEVKELFDKFTNNPNLSIFIDDDCIKFYDSNEDCLNDLTSTQEVKSRNGFFEDSRVPVFKEAKLTIYRHKKYKGRSKTYTIQESTDDNDLNNCGLDKKISSFKFSSTYQIEDVSQSYLYKKTCMVTFYAEKNCKGLSQQFFFNGKKPSGQVRDMKDIVPFGPYLKESWNDRPRSLSITVLNNR